MIADCAAHIHVAAYHASAEYNNDTPGIGALCELRENTRLAVGTFYNSYRRTSNYVGVVWQPVNLGPVRAGVMVGAVTGYKFDASIALPLAAFAFSVPVGRVELHLAAIPESSNASPATAEFSFSIKF